MLNDAISIRDLELKNRLVMPPMQTGRSADGRVTADLVHYYRDRALYAAPGLIITEHSCISEAGRSDAAQLSLADDSRIEEHRQITDAIHAAGSRVFAQLNHAGSAAERLDGGETVSASDIGNPRKRLSPPRPLTVEEIRGIREEFAEAARRAFAAGYDGVEIHCAHGYLLNQFYSPLTNRRQDAYGPQSLENRCRFLLEVLAAVRGVAGDRPVAVRLGGADYQSGGSTEEDAVAACLLLEAAGADLLDLSGGMCGFILQGHSEPGYFGSMTAKIRAAVHTPVLLTGGVTKPEQAETLLRTGKADLVGVGRALFRDAHWPSEP